MDAPLSRVVRWSLVLALALGSVVACKGDEGAQGDAPPREAPPNPPPPPAEATPAPAAPPSADQGRLLDWLDPDAISVAYMRLPERLRGDTVAVVYGLPHRAEEMLQAVADLDTALDAVRPTDAPGADTWLSTEGLVTLGRMARRPTILHPLLAPREEAVARLEALGLTKQADEDAAFEVWIPARVFPYKVALLDGDVAAFIPASEPGSGLSPLAAARDMPASDVETQLTQLLQSPEAPSLAVFAAGPMLHFDLDDSVLMVRFELRRASDGSLDGSLALQVDGDATTAAKALEDRKAPEQNDRIQQLVERAAYQVEGPVVTGRLQLSAADAQLLHASTGAH